ncbi:MAG: ScpA family protein [Patescibacteria group bacterium]
MIGVFSVTTGQFEGPLDLLLSLVEERKMLISDVSLSTVADAFLNHISGRESFPLGETAQFVAVAATLLLLKSRALLPVLTLTDDEEGDIKDLETRLRLLQIMRSASRNIAAMRITRMYFGEGLRTTEPIFTPSKDLSAEALHTAAKSALQNAPRKKFVQEIAVKAVISLDEMIERLTKRVQSAISMSFREFASGSTDPREIVVGFLAILELVKRGFAQVTQDKHYEDITIEYAGSTGTPTYE